MRGLVALVIVLAGLIIGLLSLLLPFESLYKDRLEQFLENQWDLQVKVNEIKGSWRGYGPNFLLKDLELTGQQSIQLASANLYVNVYQLMIPGGRTGIDLSINKAELDLVKSVDGGTISFDVEQSKADFADMLDQVLTTGSLRVNELMFNVADNTGDILLAGLEADLLLEQDQEQRALHILIENEADEAGINNDQSIEVKSLGLRKQSLLKDAQWYLKFNQFELSQLNDLFTQYNLPNGQLNGEIWFSLVEGSIQSITGQVSWFNPLLGLSFGVQLKQKKGFQEDKSTNQSQDWQAVLNVQNIQIKNQNLPDFEVLIQRAEDITQIKTTHIPVVFAYHLLGGVGAKSIIDPGSAVQTSGVIEGLEFSFNNRNQQMIGGYIDVNGLSVEHPEFNLQGLSGLFEFNSEQGQLLIDAANGSLSAKEIYRETLNWQQLHAQVAINWHDSVPNIQVNNLWCACEDFGVQLWSDIKLKDKTNMILNSRLSSVEVSSLHKYWPHNIWKEKALNWLDKGLLGGQVEDAFVFVAGDMVHEGFKKGVAEFNARAFTEGIENRFHPDWPTVKNIDAVVDILHDEIHVTIENADTLGLNINTAKVDIDSFEDGIITVDLNANSQNNDILDYIRTSPLMKNIALDENIKIGGRQQVNLAFDVAMKEEEKRAFDPQGQVVFRGGQFFTEHFTIDDINGPVQLDGYQLLMKNLPAHLSTAEILLNGKIITKSEQGVVVDVDLSGSLTTEYLLDLIQQDLPITGESDWNINIKNLRKGLILSAQSLLSGVSIDLPAPLDKLAEENKTLEIKCSLPCANSTVEINYNDEIKSTLSSEAGKFHLSRLQFLNSVKEMPGKDNSEELFGGYIDRLDLDQWMKLISAQSNAVSETSVNVDDSIVPSVQTNNKNYKQLPVDDIQLSIEQLTFMSRVFSGIELDIKRQAESYVIQVESEAIKGRVIIDDDLQQKGIVAEFEHLNWLDPIEDLVKVNADEAAAAKIPDIHLWVDEFSYSGVPLGEMRMEVRNVVDGIKVEQLSFKSDLAEINISGFWNKSLNDESPSIISQSESDQPAVGQSTFNIVMFSEKIADFLQTFGFKPPITNAQTLVEIKAQWDGIPSQFDIATIDGDLEIKIGQGQVLDQQPGFGRVLGLFNLTNLPRRLILDFRDVLADGLVFNGMEGKFKINKGVAHTEDFMIRASSAKIHINGDVGFADQSYDQIITIRPQIGKTFPTIGAIAGGPVGAAAGFLVQGLLGKKLKNSNQIIYQVTGTWDDPLIELIDKDQPVNIDNEQKKVRKISDQ